MIEVVLSFSKMLQIVKSGNLDFIGRTVNIHWKCLQKLPGRSRTSTARYMGTQIHASGQTVAYLYSNNNNKQ